MPTRKRTRRLVAVVMGGSRGAGRGIALALGDTGAIVYVAGRTRRGGPAPRDGAPGTIDDTADEVGARGGRGIAVPTDATDPGQVAALFERVAAEQDGLDVLANAVWGAADGADSAAESMAAWNTPFWDLPASIWRHQMDGGPTAYFLASREALRMMVPKRRGLIVGVTDGFMEGTPETVLNGDRFGEYSGNLLWDLSHVTINRLMATIAADAKRHRIAVVTLMPGFMQTERVARTMTSEAIRRQFRYDLSESTEYLGRAVAALPPIAKCWANRGGSTSSPIWRASTVLPTSTGRRCRGSTRSGWHRPRHDRAETPAL